MSVDDLADRVEYYNEYVMKANQSCWSILVYVVYFPVNLFCYFVFKNFHKIEKQTPNQLAYYTCASLITLGILSFLLAYWSALIAIS